MRVELHRDLFTVDGFESIIMLMRLFVVDRHQWFVNLDDIEEVEAYFAEHAPTKAMVYTDLARKSLVAQSHSTSSTRLQVTAESLGDHVEDLTRSAKVVVENQTADGAFIVAVAHVFAAADVVRAYKERWLEFVQGGGGGEVRKIVRAEHAAFRRVARVTFLLDSDRGAPDQVSKHERVLSELLELGVKGHILNLREIENYVPNRILAAVSRPKRKQSAISAKLNCLKELTPAQRGFIDIKFGFSREKPDAWPPQVQEAREKLYSAKIRNDLSEGFGEHLTELLRREAVAGNVTVADFESLGPGTCDELRALLALIRDII